jgi:Tetratricopeptide repeat/PEGA domain
MPPKLTIMAAMLAIALLASRASADNTSEARTRYERAVKLYEDGVYDAALVEFTRAYELNPSYKVLYNLAQVRLAMQDYAGASEVLERYLREGGRQIEDSRTESVRQELLRLEQRVARLSIQSDVSDAEVLIDDVLVGSTPLAGPLLVNSGMRRVTVRDVEHYPQTLRVSLAGGEQRTITLNLVRGTQSTNVATAPAAPSIVAQPPVAVAAVPVAAAPVAPAPRERRSRASWTVTGISAGLIVTAAALGITALLKNGDLDQRRDEPGQDVRDFDVERHRMHKMAVAADVIGLAAIAGVGVSTWLWLRPKERMRSASVQRVGIAWTGAGAQLRGEF